MKSTLKKLLSSNSIDAKQKATRQDKEFFLVLKDINKIKSLPFSLFLETQALRSQFMKLLQFPIQKLNIS